MAAKQCITRAVGYLRRSTEKQEKSLADQRAEVEKYAAEHGYAIIRWYEDDGISGDATERRQGFQAMHKAATNGRDFDAILCWDQDRFGRFNSLEAGFWIHPLMKAGVRLVTVTEGPINWQDFTGRVMYSLKQEGKHQFLVDLSRNTARGQISTAKAGFLNGQRAPYGFDRMLVNERGEQMQRIHDGDEIARPRSWKVTLVPSDDPAKIDTLRWIFSTYADTDTGLRQLADRLNATGTPGPNGGPWWTSSIRQILGNPAYVGDLAWSRRNAGKYHRVSAGEIKTRTDGPTRRTNDPAEWTGKRDAHEALIDRATFKRVQKKLTKRNVARRSRDADRYLLSGLVHCAHCGRRMVGTSKTRDKNGKHYEWHNYVCSTYAKGGKHLGCGHHNVDQGQLLAFLLGKLRDVVLAGGHRDKLRQLIVDRLAARQKADPKHAKGLEVKLSDLERQIKTGTDRLLKSPEDITDLLAPQLSAWRKERDHVATELAAYAKQSRPADIEAEADATVDRLWTMADELDLDNAEPARLREVIRRMVSRIDLWFEHVPQGKRTLCPLAKGTIELQADEMFTQGQHGKPGGDGARAVARFC
jgi:DNA invertase Pin-like site-specific DNA recombinase